MRAVIQRVQQASVRVDDQVIGEIGAGVLVLLGVGPEDVSADIDWLSRKIAHLRIFPDDSGAMNRSLVDRNFQALVVSQFTLFASTRKGTRPGFSAAAPPDMAQECYQKFCQALSQHLAQPVQQGRFAADMQVSLINDGPVTIVIDTKQKE